MKLVTILVSTFLLSGCCLVDYTDDIQVLAKPIQIKYSEFILEHKRAPTRVEDKKILTEIGCENIESYYKGSEVHCFYKGKRFTVELGNTFFPWEEGRSHKSTGYSIKIKYAKSNCNADIRSDIGLKKISCYNINCIQWSH